jgi:hypothetical protein
MVLPNGTSMPVNQFFVAFDDATPERHSGHYHGFWGIPVATNTWQADGSVYLNTVARRNRDRIAINIPPNLVQQVLARFHLNGHDQLRGRYVLFFGAPHVTQSGQFTLYVDNPAHMAVIERARLEAIHGR